MALLIQALTNNEESEIRVAAIDALGKIGQATKAIPELLKALTNDASSQVRVAAANILGDIKTTPIKILPYLIKALIKDSSPYVRQAAAKALGNIGVALKTVPDRKVAISALQKIDPKWPQNENIQKLIPYFVRILANMEVNPELRVAVILFLQRVINPVKAMFHNSNLKISPHFINALSDPNDKVRRATVLVLSKMKLDNTGIISHFFDTLIDENIKVRKASILALKRSDINFDRYLKFTLYRFFERIENRRFSFEIRYDIAKVIDTFQLIKWLPKDKIDRTVPYLLAALLDKKMNSIAISIFKLLNEIDPQWAERQEISDNMFYSLVKGFKKSISEHGFYYIVHYAPVIHTFEVSYRPHNPQLLYKKMMEVIVRAEFFNVETVKFLNQMGFVVGIAIMLAIQEYEYLDSIKIKEREDILWKIETSIKIFDPTEKWRKAYISHRNIRYWDY